MTITNNWMEHTLLEIAEKGDIEIHADQLVINSVDDLTKKIAEIISYLLDTNFEKLLWILYRVDVDEEKAKKLLSEHLPEAAPMILAELIVQRQIKKEELKQQFKSQVKSDDMYDDLKL